MSSNTLKSPMVTRIIRKPRVVKYYNTHIRVKKIIMVYQLKYTNGGIYGIGDFIRGCFCLIRICKKMGLEFDIDLSNHPVSMYIEGHNKNVNLNYNNIAKMDISYNVLEHMLKSRNLFVTDFTNLLRTINQEVYYTSSNSFPVFKIEPPDIEFIKSKFMPSEQTQKDIEQEMTSLNLINIDFSVIHIRTGDNCLFGNTKLNHNTVINLFNKLSVLLNNKNHKYLILSDNVNLKVYFKRYANCVFQTKPITHLGEQPVLKDNEVKNTMLDFYIMSYAKNIYSYSVYGHGSGFSKGCAILFNIPYQSYLITSD